MQELIRAVIALIVQAAVFFLLGSLLINKLKITADSGFAFLLGYLLYFGMFEIIAVPMVLLWVKLHVLCLIWGGILAGLCLYAVILLRKNNRLCMPRINSVRKEHSAFIILVLAVVLLQCIIVVLYQDSTVDATYYVGTVSTAVYTDKLHRYSPYSGKLLTKFDERYIFSAFPLSNAFWCKVLGVHPMVQCKIVMSLLHVAAANMTIYQIAGRLFRGGRKQADLMVVFVCLMQLFSYTLYTPGTFFFTRCYEGKAMLANISFPMIVLCALWLWQEAQDHGMWTTLFLTAMSAIAFSGSATMFPVCMAAGILPVMIVKKKKSGILPFLLCQVPAAVYLTVYLAAVMGWITLRAS